MTVQVPTFTCDRCLDGWHVRCVRPCACGLCAQRRRTPAPTAVKPAVRRRPKQRAITDQHLTEARRLLNQEHPPTLSEIARQLDVDRSNLHRHLFGKRSGQRKVGVPKLANPKPITEDVISAAAARISKGDYSSFTQLAYDLGVERTGLYKHLKRREQLQ